MDEKETKQARIRLGQSLRDDLNNSLGLQARINAQKEIVESYDTMMAALKEGPAADAAKAEERVAELKQEEATLLKSLPALRAETASEKKELQHVREEKLAEISSLDKTINERQAKLAAIENAIGEKVQVLGGMIAKELV